MMTKTDYENVQRILRGLPVGNGVRLNAVVSACQLFSASNPRFNRIRFAEGAGTFPCKEEGCQYVFDTHELLLDHQEFDHKKKAGK
jgi:hypothetical protein